MGFISIKGLGKSGRKEISRRLFRREWYFTMEIDRRKIVAIGVFLI